MRLEHILIAGVIFFSVMTLSYSFLSAMITDYGVDANSSIITEKLRNISESQRVKEELRSDTQLSAVSDEDTESSLYKQGVPGMLNMFQSIEVSGAALEEVNSQANIISPFMIQTLIIILTILAASFVLYMIWRFQPQK